MMRSRKQMVSLGLILAMAASGSISAYGETVPEGYDAQTWARLQDNVLEYDEIENLVEEYNPDFQLLKKGIAYNTTPFTNAAATLRTEAETFIQMAKDAKDMGNTGEEQQYRKKAADLKKQAASMESSAKSETRLQVKQVRQQLISGVRTLMIGYHQAAVHLESLNTGVELAQASFESAQAQKNLGMVTDTQVQSAQKSLESAKSQLKSLEDKAGDLRQSLSMMTGWSYDAKPEIGQIPVPDLSKIDHMDLKEDLAKALNNNYALIALRNTKARAASEQKTKSRKISEAQEMISSGLTAAYENVLKSRAAYEAAGTAFQSARLTMDGNDLKYQMKMLGRLEYLQAKLAFQMAGAEVKSAALDLMQAMDSYYWAVEGLGEIQ